MKKISASLAKAKFSEVLDRVQSGENFSITLHGKEVAKLVPAGQRGLDEVQQAIAGLKKLQSILNPAGKGKLQLKALINEGRE